MQVKAIKTAVFRENEDLIRFILRYVKKLPEKSILVVTSKIIALSEGRTVELKDEKQKARIIKKESEFAIKTKRAWLTIKDGAVMASAGVDESNAAGKLILLPRNSFVSAEMIRNELMKKFKVQKLGVLVTDSRTFPLRAGIVGMALGYAGFKGIRDYRGTGDIFGRKLKMSRTNVADSLAAAAVLCMGEGKERQPLAILEDAPAVFSQTINPKEILINPKIDLYLPFFRRILRK